MLDTVLTIIGGLIMLTVLVVAHEFGHFYVGKRCGIDIEEFSVGFGPKILQRIRGGVKYSLRALPLGGYVQFFGEDAEVDNNPRAFNNAKPLKRFLTYLAGPFMNLLFAFVVTVVVLLAFGEYAPTAYNVTDGGAAYQAGIRNGDRLAEVNGHKLDFSMEFDADYFFYDENGEILSGVDVTVERDGELIETHINYTADEEGKVQPEMGYNYERRYFGVFEAIGLAFKWLYLIVMQMLDFLKNLIFMGQGASDVAGPVGTISIIGQAIRSGWEVVLRIAALLSVNLFVMNLLPFPALDGGRIVLLGIEKLRGKPIPRDKEAVINLAGMAVLLGLMIVLTYQDVSRLITGG